MGILHSEYANALARFLRSIHHVMCRGVGPPARVGGGEAPAQHLDPRVLNAGLPPPPIISPKTYVDDPL